MSNPPYNPYASGTQRSTQGQYGLTDTQAGMDPLGDSSHLGSRSDLRSSGPSTNPGGIFSSLHPQTVRTADMETTIDMHIRGARDELRLLSQMVKQKRQQLQQAADRDPHLTRNPREEMPSLGAGLTSCPMSSSASLGCSVEHSDKQSGAGSSMDWLSSYQEPTAASSSNFYYSSSSKAQNVPLFHSSQSSNVFQTASYTAGVGGSSSNTSSERGGAMSSIPGRGDYSLSDQPSSSSTTNATRSKYTFESATNILQNFGLENEDLERLNDYTDNELTPDNLPFILRDICHRKTNRAKAASGSDVDHRLQTSGGVSGPDLCGASGVERRSPEESTPILRQPSKVIDYGHSSKYTEGFGDEIGGGSSNLGSSDGGNESTSMMDSYSSSSHGREPPPKDFGTVKYSGAGSSRDQISSISGSSSSYGSILSSVTPPSLDPPKRSQRPEQTIQSIQSPVQKLIKKPISLSKKDEDNRILKSKPPKSILVKKPASTTTLPPRPTLVRGVNPDRPGLVVLGSEVDDGTKNKAKDQGQADTGHGQTMGLPPMNKNVPPPPFHIPGVPYIASALNFGQIPLMHPPTLPHMTVPPPPLKPPSSTTVAKGLPTPTMMSDYSAITPRIFPHTCSLCNIECKKMKDWITHQNSSRHIESCSLLRKKYPDWNGETTPAPSPVSRDIQVSPSSSQSSKHRRQATSSSHSHSSSRSRSCSPCPRRYTRPRSPSPRRYTQSRSPRPRRYSRSRSPRPWRYSRSRSPSPRHYFRPRSPSPGYYSRSRYSRTRFPSPRCYSHSRSPSPGSYTQSRSPNPLRYSCSRSPIPGRYSHSHSPRPRHYSWNRSPSPRRYSRSRSPSSYHGNALSGSTREAWEEHRARSPSPRSPRRTRRSLSRSPHYSPRYSPQRSPYHSPQLSPYHSPQCSPYRSLHCSPISSSSSRSMSFERWSSPKSSSCQQKETSTERLAKKLKTSDRSGLDTMVQSLTPADVIDLIRSSPSSPSSSSSSRKKGSSKSSSVTRSGSVTSKTGSALSSQGDAYKKQRKANPFHRKHITSHSSTSKSSDIKSTITTVFQTPKAPTTTPEEKPWCLTTDDKKPLLPTPKIKPLIKPLLPLHMIRPLLGPYITRYSYGFTTCKTKIAATKQNKKSQHGKAVVKVVAKKAAAKGSASKAKIMGKIVTKPKQAEESVAAEPKMSQGMAKTAKTIKVKVAKTTAPKESKAKPYDSSITLAAAKAVVYKAKATGKIFKKSKQSKTAVLKKSRPTGTGPKEGSKHKDFEITRKKTANETNDGQPKTDCSLSKTSENPCKSKDTPSRSSDPTPTSMDTSTTLAQPEAAPKDSTTPVKVDVETSSRHSTTSSKAETTLSSNGVTMATAEAAQHLCFRHPESMRVDGLSYNQIRKRFDIMGYTKMAMITNLPEWEADDSYTQQEIIDLLAEHGYIHREDSLYILPHQRMAFFQMPYWRDLVDLVRTHSNQPHSLRGSTLIFHIVMEPLNFSQEAAYTYLMGLSNTPAVDTATLKERLVLFSSVTVCYLRSAQEIWEAVKAIAHVRNYLPLMDRVYVEFGSAEDMNKVIRWFKESTLLNRYTLHTFKPAHLMEQGLDRTESSSSRGRHTERSSPARSDSSRRRRRTSSSGSSPASRRSRHDESPTDRMSRREENAREDVPPQTFIKLEGIPMNVPIKFMLRVLKRFGTGKKFVELRHPQEALVWFERKEEAEALVNCKNFTIGRNPISVISYKSSSSRGRHTDCSSPERRDSPRRRRRSSSSGSSPASRRSRHDKSQTDRRRREGACFATDDFKEDDIAPHSDTCPFNMDDLNWEQLVTVDEVGDVSDKSSRLPHKSSYSSSDSHRSTKTPSMPERSSKRKRMEESSSSSSFDKRSRKYSLKESPKTRSSSSSSSKKIILSQDSSKRRQSAALAEARRRAADLLKNVIRADAAEVMIGLERNDSLGFPVTSQYPESDLSAKSIESVVAKSDHMVSAETAAVKTAESETEMDTSVTQPQVPEKEGVEGTNQAHIDSPPQGKDGQNDASPSLEPGATEADLKTDLKETTEDEDEKPEDEEGEEENHKILNSLDYQQGIATEDGYLVDQETTKSERQMETSATQPQVGETKGLEGTNQAHRDSPPQGKDGQSGASPSLEPGSTEVDLKTDLKTQQKKSTTAARKTPAKKSQPVRSTIQRRTTRSSATVTSTDTTPITTAIKEVTDNTAISQPMEEVVTKQVNVAVPITEGVVSKSDHKVLAEVAALKVAESETEMETSLTQPQVAEKEGVEGTNQAHIDSPPQGKDGQSGASPSLEPDATEDGLKTDLKKTTEEDDEKPEGDKGQDENYEILNSLDDQEGKTTEDGYLVDQETTELQRQMETSATQPQVGETEGFEGTNQAHRDSPPQGKDGQSGASPSLEPGSTEVDLKTDLKTQQKKSTTAARKTPAKKSQPVRSTTQRRTTRSSVTVTSTDTTSKTTAIKEVTDDTATSQPMKEVVTKQVTVAAPITEGVVAKSDHKVLAEVAALKIAESETEMETSVTQPQVAEKEGVEGKNQAHIDSPPQGKEGQSGASPSLEPDATEDGLKTDLKKTTEEDDEKPEGDEGQDENYEILNSLDDQEGKTTEDGYLVDQETTELQRQMETSTTQPQVGETEGFEGTNQAHRDLPPQGKDGQSGASPSLEPGATEVDLKTDLKTQQKKSTTAARKTPAKKSQPVRFTTQRRTTRSSVTVTSTDITTAIKEVTDNTVISQPMEEVVTKQVNVAVPITEGVVAKSDLKLSAEAAAVKSAESETEMETSVTQPQVAEKEGVEGTNQAQRDSPPPGKEGQSGASPLQ